MRWKVEGPRGTIWFDGRNGDEACEKYVARFRLTPWEHDALVVTDVERDDPNRFLVAPYGWGECAFHGRSWWVPDPNNGNVPTCERCTMRTSDKP